VSDTSKTFIGRWSQRKIKAREAEATELAAKEAAQVAATAAAVIAATEAETDARDALKHGAPAALAAGSNTPDAAPDAAAATATPSPTGSTAQTTSSALPSLADVAKLTSESDYSVFMAKGVAPEVKNAAMKKLFSDPHYNIMDGLDIYIDDYSSPEIMPASMLRKMASARVLNLFTDEDEAKAVAADLAAAEDEAAAEAAAGTGTALPVSNPEATASDPGDRLPDATALPRSAPNVLASAPRADVSRIDGDDIAPSRIPSRSGDS
jgi:hypothetical protein